MDLFAALKDAGIRFMTGVPDSTLKAFCWSVCADPAIEHVPAACEGGALALAAGYWIATGRVPCIYLQNSGLPNALNPLMALASAEAFDLPLLLVVGWRGRPGLADEPQHRGIGRETLALLTAAGVEPLVLDGPDLGALAPFLARLGTETRRGAIVVSPAATEAGASGPAPGPAYGLSKREMLATLVDSAGQDALFVTGIGHTAREMMALRRARGQDEYMDLPAVGGMGFAATLAAGLALGAGGRRVICLDGDGSFLMHAGNQAIVGARPGLPLTHILFDNGCHASVGGHPTAGGRVDYPALALALGYPAAETAESVEALTRSVRALAGRGGAGLIHVPVVAEPVRPLPRPARPLDEGLAAFRARLHALPT